MAAPGPADLVTCPAEIVLNILVYLTSKKDWLALARICRRISHSVVPELRLSSIQDDTSYALWYACAYNRPDILQIQIAMDPTVVGRHFMTSFRPQRAKQAQSQTQWEFCPKFKALGQNMSPLSLAIVTDSAAAVQLLLDNGANPTHPDLWPPFRRWGSKEFYNLPTHDNSIELIKKWFPIHWAVEATHEGSVAIIQMLGAKYSESYDKVKSVLDIHGSHWRIPVIKLLELQKPRRAPAPGQTSCEGFNNDFRRLQDLRLRQLKALLQYPDVDPNLTMNKENSITPISFILSTLNGYKPSFYFEDNLILSHEEDVQADIVNEIAISFLEVLRDFGADIRRLGPPLNSSDSADFETPLHSACKLKERHRPIFLWFLRNGVPVDILSRGQRTPLMAYCSSPFTDVDLFKRFLEYKPLINHADNTLGRTALHELCANVHLGPQVREKAVKMLLDRGADTTYISNVGITPVQELEPAASIINNDVTRMLKRAMRAWRGPGREAHQRHTRDTADNTTGNQELPGSVAIPGSVAQILTQRSMERGHMPRVIRGRKRHQQLASN
ncbi:ankyrin repeat-containing domain protein [Astrocystis sublimbata]|nr:ankyrin repeat-containing domain protein [Astrocystis sublimbata]